MPYPVPENNVQWAYFYVVVPGLCVIFFIEVIWPQICKILLWCLIRYMEYQGDQERARRARQREEEQRKMNEDDTQEQADGSGDRGNIFNRMPLASGERKQIVFK